MRQNRRIFSAYFVPFAPSLAVGLAVLAGCGDGKISTYPVTGTVQVDGKPAAGAVVIFCPTEGTEEFKRERPFGNADASGKFQLTTFNPQDGAPAGDYKVMIRWPAPKRATPPGEDPNRSTAGFDLLNGRYFNPDQSGLTATVADGPSELPPFELESK